MNSEKCGRGLFRSRRNTESADALEVAFLWRTAGKIVLDDVGRKMQRRSVELPEKDIWIMDYLFFLRI